MFGLSLEVLVLSPHVFIYCKLSIATSLIDEYIVEFGLVFPRVTLQRQNVGASQRQRFGLVVLVHRV